MALVLGWAKLKQPAQPKNLISEINERTHQIVKYAYRKIAHFFSCQNDHHLGAVIIFDYKSSSPTPLFTLSSQHE